MKQKSGDAGKRAWIFGKRVFNSPFFNSDVSKYRTKFGIRISKGSVTDHEWFTQLYLDSLEQIDSKDRSVLKRMVDQFRRHSDIHREDLNRLLNNKRIKIIEAWYDLEDMRSKYAIPPRWRHGMITYLLTDNIDKVGLPASVSMNAGFNGFFYRDEIILRLDRFTRREDLMEMWKAIEAKQRRLWGGDVRVANVKTFKKLEKAALLRKEGKTYKEIGEALDCTSGDARNYEMRYYRSIGIDNKRVRSL